jgi:hypothetical protein
MTKPNQTPAAAEKKRSQSKSEASPHRLDPIPGLSPWVDNLLFSHGGIAAQAAHLGDPRLAEGERHALAEAGEFAFAKDSAYKQSP